MVGGQRLRSACRSVLVLAALALLALPGAAHADMRQTLDRLGGEPCAPGEPLICVGVSVPLDHFDAAVPGTLDVVAAVEPAARQPSRGLLVTIVGGPGASGVADGRWQRDLWSPAVRAAYDLVYIDQRGIGRSGGLYCPQANLLARRAEGLPAAGDARTARRFAERCTAELDSTRLLPYLATAQAVEDLEAVRQALGAPPMALYGQSYGTQVAAAYARRYPNGLHSLILDGVVDTSLGPAAFWRSAARGFEAVLDETLAICARRAACRVDMPQGAGAVYDRLDRRLARGPLRVARGTGWLTRAMLRTSVASALYSPGGRLDLLEDLAAYARGDVSRLVEGAWIAEGVDPTTWTLLDTGTSIASYFGIQCADGIAYTGTSEERARTWLAEAAAVDAALPRIGGAVITGDLPCAWWPGTPAPVEPPPPLVLPGVPALVLTATGDPITPHWQGAAVARALDRGRLIRTIGGGHVTLDRDEPCSYAPVAALLLRDRLPRGITTCRAVMVPAYWSATTRRGAG